LLLFISIPAVNQLISYDYAEEHMASTPDDLRPAKLILI